ncbi:MAG: DUF4249 family protein, partial [Owenweeksia sp.]
MKKFWFILLPMAFSLSCTKDVDIDIPGSEPQAVLNVLMETGDSVVNASLNISVPYAQTSSPRYVKYAELRLYEDGNLRGFFDICEMNPVYNFDGLDTQYVYCIAALVREGHTYRVEADVPGFGT